jgi:hypothetical protein
MHWENSLSVVAYLDDGLIYYPNIDQQAAFHALCRTNMTVNMDKSVLQPSSSVHYLGFQINIATVLIG